MSRHTHGARWQHHARRHAYAMVDAAIQHQQPNLQRRADSDNTAARQEDCEGDDSAGCEKPAGAASTLPIVLGSLIPVFLIVFALVWLHRRHMNKLKEEDSKDKTKSMDFGLGGHTQPRHNPSEKSDSRARRQMSMDLTVNSPYLMPGVIHDSKESLNTLARTPTGDDRYAHSRPSTSGNGASTPPRSHSARPTDDRDSSIYAPSGYDSPDGSQHSMNAELLSGASRMATTSPPPPRKASMGPTNPPRSVPQIVVPSPPSRANGLPASPRSGTFPLGGAQSPETQNSDRGLPASLMTGVSSPTIVVQPTPQNPASQQPLFNDTSATYMPEVDSGPSFRFSVASEEEEDEPVQVAAPADARKSLAPGALENRRLSMGSRPLPPDGKSDDTAEERAMRIRSFYKEYFSVEESGPPPPMPTGPGAFYGSHADYSQEHGARDETAAGGFTIPGARPFAEGPVRRAMTPPPRMPPRFQGHGGPPSNPGSRAGSAAGGRFMPPQPRSFSSASNHMGGPPRGPANKRPVAPPQPLSILPTPSMLKEDAFAMPIIFAPNVRGEDVQPRGGLRPYSPAVPAFNPLISSFDDMALLPSPHMLRKSGYFTALDFAPPQKFKNDDAAGGGGSDAGSIRSHRSGTSAMHQQNIRQGAYRVSRIPTDVVPMKDDLAAELRPTWDVGRPT